VTDDQLSRRFRVVNEPIDPDPAFREDLFAELAGRLGLETVELDLETGGRLARVDAHAPARRRPPWRLLLVAALLLIGLAAAVAFVGSQPARDDLLTRLRASGVVRVAVRPDFPQSPAAGLAGFDVDVAHALASHLALSDEVRPVDLPAMAEQGQVGWDLAMPSVALTEQQMLAFVTSRPYYYWSVYLLVPAGDPAAAPEDLSGRRICVTAGSSGEAWLQGRLPSTVTGAPAPPSGVGLRTETADRACFDALVAGEVDAMVTSTMSAADLATRSSARAVGDGLYQEPRVVVAVRDGPDPSRLMTMVDSALDEMSADGTLTDLSRNRFGGRDLTVADSP
jgi:ABC-type amino acid transport substrate-binding protein